MKKSIAMAVLVTLFAVSAAQAAGPITRNGADADGNRNPGGCVVQPEGTDMHVNCTTSSDSAFVRFRFLDDVGGVRAPATVSLLLRDQDQETCAIVRWMAPVRTLRVEVLAGCYVHIVSVTWSQP